LTHLQLYTYAQYSVIDFTEVSNLRYLQSFDLKVSADACIDQAFESLGSIAKLCILLAGSDWSCADLSFDYMALHALQQL